MNNLDIMVAAYIETALWSTTDNSTPQGGEPLDKNYDADDIAPDTMRQMREDCNDFLNANMEDVLTFDDRLRKCLEQAGHYFWLTRNGHGAGFWDGDWEHEVGQRLTKAAKVYGGVDLIVGDDGKIH